MAHGSQAITPGVGGTPIHDSRRVLNDGTTVATQHIVYSGADGSQSTRTVSVTSTRAALVTLLADRIALMVHNKGTVIVYLGGSDVTADDAATTGGWELAPGEKMAIGFAAPITIYAVTASTTASVKVWQVS